jgi:Zn-dependent protease
VFLAEPKSTRFDVHFKVLGIPVRVHPLFWIVTSVFGMIGTSREHLFAHTVLWIAAVLISLIVHEMGHALMARKYGWPPHITLYGMGGLAHYDQSRQTRKQEVIIALAGPFAGFLFGGIVVGVLLLLGQIEFGPDLLFGRSGTTRFSQFVGMLMTVNFFWGLLNLLPIQPLDGGTVSAAVIRKLRPRNALEISLKVSMGTAVLIGALGLIFLGSVFIAVLFGALAFTNWQLLQQLRGRGPVHPA